MGQPEASGAAPAWCSLHVRFNTAELRLLREAERHYGARLADADRPEALREALSLARTGGRVRGLLPGESVSLDVSDLLLLVAATRACLAEPGFATLAARLEALLNAG